MILQSRLFILFLFILFLPSCSNEQNDRQNSESVPGDSVLVTSENKSPTAFDVSGCYMGTLKRDTFALHLVQVNDSLSGQLTFNNYEKDGSTGTVHGSIRGDTLKLWYDFNSEGMRSVMEVYFKKEGEQLIRGIGAVAGRNDTTYYGENAAIDFHPSQVFKKLECDELPGKYK